VKLNPALPILVITVLFVSCVSQTVNISESIDFSSVKRLQINQSFPNAEKVQAELARRGYPWSSDDWFGPEITDPWVVEIGAQVDVRTVQDIVKICLTYGSRKTRFNIMQEDEGFDNRKRVYIGSLDFKDDPLLADTEIKRLLSPGFTQEQYQELVKNK
jgi:hypothetical protein